LRLSLASCLALARQRRLQRFDIIGEIVDSILHARD
jgi:hypothetical protein